MNPSSHPLNTTMSGSLPPSSSKSTAEKLEELLELTASKTSSLDLAPVLSFLGNFFDDSSPTLCKHSILCFSRLVVKVLYTINFQPSDATRNLWKEFNSIKSKIISTAKFSHNDGVIIHALKFMEVIILGFTSRDSQTSRPKEELFNVEMISGQHPLLSRPQLEKEGEDLLHTLVSWLDQIGNWSSTAIIVVITCLSSIVKQRPQFVSLIAPALMQIPKKLHTISSQSQLPSIQNALRTSLSSIAKIRHPAVAPFLQSLLNTLPALGVVRTEQGSLKRPPSETLDQTATKYSKRRGVETPKETIDLTTASQFVEILLNAQLSPELFADLIIDNMINLPPFPANSGPSPFDPFDYLIKSLLQIQTPPSVPPPNVPPLTIQPVVPTFQPPLPQPTSRSDPRRDPRLGMREAPFNPPPEPMVLESSQLRSKEEYVPPSLKAESENFPPPSVSQPMVYSPKIPALSKEDLQKLHESSFLRILSAEKGASMGGKSQLRSSILSHLSSQIDLDNPLLQKLYSHIFEDYSIRKELALQWLTTEFKHVEEHRMDEGPSRYEQIFLAILTELKQIILASKDQKSFSFLFIKAPKLTHAVYDQLRFYCEDANTVTLGLSTLRDIILYRTDDYETTLNVLLYYTQFEIESIRSPAIRLVTNKLFGHNETLSEKIETFATELLSSLHTFSVTEDTLDEKLEEDIKRKLFLYFAICTKKPSLLLGLVENYTKIPAGLKKVIHIQSVGLIKTIGMNSPEFLQLLGTIPHKGEPLILHFLHTLTEKARPSPQLVTTIKTLYQKRVLDPRFIIPVLPGLEKTEVMDFIPKLCSLPSNAIKSAINNILKNPTVSPSELLVALHLIDTKDPEHLKKCIEATQLCFDQKDVFNQDVLAVVLQQLVDVNPLPSLLLRTIMQTISRYQRLIGFVMGILSRLINKNIWNDPKLWEGFIKTCKMTLPHSCSILIQVPATQLEDMLQKSPELKQPLANYCRTYPNKVKTIPFLQKLLEE